MLIAVLGMSLNMMAGTTTKSCKISGGQDGATVVASIIEVGDGYVMVELDNDGSFPVNVTVTVFKSKGNQTTGQRSCKVSNQASNTIKVPVNGAKATDPVSNYSITALSGSRCN